MNVVVYLLQLDPSAFSRVCPKSPIDTPFDLILVDPNCRYYIVKQMPKNCLWTQRTHHRLENGSLGFIETLHKQ